MKFRRKINSKKEIQLDVKQRKFIIQIRLHEFISIERTHASVVNICIMTYSVQKEKRLRLGDTARAN